MLRHPGGEKHSRYLIELSFLEKGSKWLDMGAGDGSGVRLLRNLGYRAEGIDLDPRGKEVTRGDYRNCPWQEDFFDGILSECAFYVGGDYRCGKRLWECHWWRAVCCERPLYYLGRLRWQL